MARKNKGEIVSIEIVDIYGEPFDLAAFARSEEGAEEILKVLGPFFKKCILESKNKSETKECQQTASTEQ